MKKLYELSISIDKKVKNILPKLEEAQKETAKEVEKSIKNKAPYKTGKYSESIKTYDTEKKKNEISTFIGSDLQVNTKAGNSYNLGFLLETGTDPHAIPNAFGWGDIYGYDSPQYQRTLDPDWHPGTIAQPHYKPALEENKKIYLDKIGEAIKEAMKNG